MQVDHRSEKRRPPLCARRQVARVQLRQHPQQLRDVLEVLLVAAQVRHADVVETIEIHVYHLVVEQLLAEVVGADAEVTVGTREQILLQPIQILLQGGDDGGVRLRELSLHRRILRVLERVWDILLEEADNAGQLLDRDLGVNLRRILQILSRGDEHCGHLLLTGDEQA